MARVCVGLAKGSAVSKQKVRPKNTFFREILLVE